MSKIAVDLAPQINWAQEQLVSVREDPEISAVLAQISLQPTRMEGCATTPPSYYPGFASSQWIQFKTSFPADMTADSVVGLMGSPYCLVSPDKIHRANYRRQALQGSVQVARWLPVNSLSETNVLDVYFQNGKVVTYDVYPLTPSNPPIKSNARNIQRK